MSELNSENEPDEVKKPTIVFVEKNETDNFNDELPVKDAEILGETPPRDKKHDVQNDITTFLENLPDDINPVLVITRQPDKSAGRKFRTVCDTQEHAATLNWNSFGEPSEILSEIANLCGGGRYTIQVKTGQRFSENQAWTTIIGDPPELSVKEKTALDVQNKKNPPAPETQTVYVQQPPPQSPPPAAETGDDVDKLITALEKVKKLNDLITPAQVPQPAAAPLMPTITKESIKMELIQKALGNEALVEKAIDAVFDIAPEQQDQSGNFVVETIKFASSHPEQTKTVVDIFFGSIAAVVSKFLPKPAPPQAPPITIRQQPPPGATVRTAQNPIEQFMKPADAPEAARTVETQPEAQNAPETATQTIEPAEEFPVIELA